MPVDDNCDVHGEAGVAAAGSPEPTNQLPAVDNSRNVPIQIVKPMYHVEGGSQSASTSPVDPAGTTTVLESGIAGDFTPVDPDEMMNIRRQQDEIEQETKQQPLVTPKLPMATLVEKYSEGSQFRQKAIELAELYKHIQFIRRDGNCFYRAILSALFDTLSKDEALFNRFFEHSKGWFKRIVDLGYTEFTASDICEHFTDALEAVKEGERELRYLIVDLTNDATSNYYVSFLRLITAGLLREREDDFSPFLSEYSSMKDFCEHEVEPMWREADHLAIVGLSHALNLSIRVEYLDQNAAPDGRSFYNFIVDGDEEPKLVVLFTPGHYDVLYKE
uniref:ubiquitinyl hydrolase 1 n=1 Tax=Steinernema glaseri TaxID=37863 RepID=A0A1I8ABQ5_9BILA